MYVQKVLIVYTITKTEKGRYNHGCNKLDNCNEKQKNRKNIITQSRTEMDL